MTLKTLNNEEELFRIHIREKFVDTGFIDVHQWKGFSDTFKIEMDKARQEFQEKIMKEIDCFQKNTWKDKRTFEGIKCKTCLPLDWYDEHIDELKSNLNKLFEENGNTKLGQSVR